MTSPEKDITSPIFTAPGATRVAADAGCKNAIKINDIMTILAALKIRIMSEPLLRKYKK
jgi:hypothetical protein